MPGNQPKGLDQRVARNGATGRSFNGSTETIMTDTPSDPNGSVEDLDDNGPPLPDPDGETEREDGGDEEGLEGLRNLT